MMTRNFSLGLVIFTLAAPMVLAQHPTVQVGTDGILTINGQPHFVIGMYNAG
jgi:hypothetical protein